MKLDISQAQLRRAYNGHPIQLKHHQIGSGIHFSALHPEVKKRIEAAHKNKRGVRLHMSREELMSGQGIKEFFQKLGKAAKKVINSDAYQKYVRPIARELVDQAIDLNPLPEKDLQKSVARRVGDKTKAFGIVVPPVLENPKRKAPVKRSKKGRKNNLSGSSFMPAGY